MVQITGTIENEGDEIAQSVSIETTRTNKVLIEVGTLGVGEEREVTTNVSEADIGVDKDGYYNIPLRVLYKDSNQAPFSAAFINAYTKKGASSRSSPVSLALDEVIQKAGGVDIANSGNFVLALSNTGTTPVEINLELLGTKEIELQTENTKLTLAPQEEKTIDVSVKNLSALAGSSYASYALISGVLEGQSFSDYIGFVINIRSKTEVPIMIWFLVGLALVFGVVGFRYWRRESSEKAEQA